MIAPSSPGQPVVVRAGEGERIVAAGVDHLFALTGDQTGGLLGLEHFSVPPRTLGARPHVHHGHDEYFYVLEGELTIVTAAGEVVLSPGDLATAPRGALHGFLNPSETVAVRGLGLYTPPGYEQYFRDVHAAVESGAELTDELLAGLRSHHRTETP